MLPHHRVKRRAVIPPIVLEPAAERRVEHARQILDRFITAQMQLPASNLRSDGLPCLFSNGRTEVDEVSPFPVLRSPGAKRITQKIEFLVRVFPSSVVILAIDDLRLCRMKLQPTVLYSCRNGRPNLLGLCLCFAMHNCVIGVPLER